MILSHHARSATWTTIGKHNKKWETSMKWPLRHLYEMLRKASWGTIKVFFSTFHFSLLFPVLFPRCASLLYSPLHYPVVGSKSSSLHFRQRARALKRKRLVALGSPPRGGTTGCYNEETQREANNGEMMQNEKCHLYSVKTRKSSLCNIVTS